MPPLAIAGVAAAVIGGGATLLASGKNSKAINKSTAAQTASNTEQIGFQRESRAQSTAALSPYMQRGNVAGDTINAALGIGGSYAAAGTASLPTQQPLIAVPYNGGYPDASNYPGYYGDLGQGALAAGYPGMPMQTMGAAPAGQPGAPPVGQTPAQAASSAYELFKQSTGYQARLQEGQRGQGAMYSALGTYQSGARDKALARFNQDYASNEFGNWLGQLGNQQGVGFAGASALAGVGQGFADRMGDISQNNANAASQAAVARAANSGALMTGLAGIAGQTVGALSSYNRPPTQQPVGGWGTPGYY